ncbi:MAG: dehydrogenase E1 component subunit alpha/beta [Bacteroidota bacterium]
MNYQRKSYDNNQLIDLYKGLLKPRLIEEKMLILLRQSKVSKWFSGIGQEAISVGATMALDQDEYILPLHRNLGVFTSRQIPLKKLIAQWQGKYSGFTKGRDRSFHFGTNEYHIVGMISHLGAMLGVADGIALAHKLKNEKKVSLVFSGDGGSSEGDFHESLNTAAVWELPVIFLIENNGYGLSTPSNEQFKFRHFTDKGPGYGIESWRIDGNNILEVYDTVRNLAISMRNRPRPIILECITFRMRGHEEASGTKYVPQHLFDEWGKKDPLMNYENWLLEEKIISTTDIENFKVAFKKELDEAIEHVFSEPEVDSSIEHEIADIYKKIDVDVNKNDISLLNKNTSSFSIKRLVDAISDGLKQSMEKHPNLIIMGQDVAEYGGVFKITQGFVEQFGKERVRNTPLCESAIVGASYGLSIKGMKAVVEMQFADFVTCGFNQIVNNLAKSHYRWEQQADVVVRMPTGAGVGAGPFHSQSNEAWFFHVPGLKIIYPSSPAEAKGLLCAAINDPNPVMFFEHKHLYRMTEIEEEVFDEYYTLPIGKARIVKEGNDLTIIAYGASVHWAKETVAKNNIDAEIIDLRSLMPWDKEAVYTSVKKTGKAIIYHEDTLTGGIGAEIAACIAADCFEYLDAPVMRTASLDTPVPLANNLEWQFLPKDRFEADLLKLYNF